MRVDSIHCHMKNISRGNGTAANAHSSVAAAAYLSRSRLKDERTGRVHRYTRKDTDILHTDTLLPVGAPAWAKRRGKLWNAVEAAERRKDARVAKSIEVAIVRELPRSQWVPLIKAFSARFTEQGIAVDYAIHLDDEGHNPHCHLLLTTRVLTPDGFTGGKLQFMNKKTFLEDVRQAWAEASNSFLIVNNIAVRVDHRSFKTRGIDRSPTRHRGRAGQQPVRDREIEHMRHGPTSEERERYPNLTERADWPPRSEIPARDMTPEVRAELTAYWQEREGLIVERSESARGEHKDYQKASLTPEREPVSPLAADPEPTVDTNRAPERAGTFGLEQRFASDVQSRERAERILAEDRVLVSRALEMNRTRQEHNLLTEARKQSPELAEKVERHLLAERVMELKAQDQNRRYDALREEIRQGSRLQERAHIAATFDRAVSEARERTRGELDNDRPEPGPDRGIVHPQRQVDQAQDRMLDDYERSGSTVAGEKLRAEARDMYMSAEEKARYDQAAALSPEKAKAEFERIVDDRVASLRDKRPEPEQKPLAPQRDREQER